MADVTLAECDGQLWLVGGEEHMDALLVGELSPDVTVEHVNCASRAEMIALWQRLTPDTDGTAQPWVINPLLTPRLRTTAGVPVCIAFAPWSAALDQPAQDTLAATAAWLAANPGGTVALRQSAAPGAPPGHADIQRIRVQLALATLHAAGADPARIRQADPDPEADPGTDPGTDALELLTEPAS